MGLFYVLVLIVCALSEPSQGSSYKVHRVIFTGGPAGGKSTILKNIANEPMKTDWVVGVAEELATDLMTPAANHPNGKVPSVAKGILKHDHKAAVSQAEAKGHGFDYNEGNWDSWWFNPGNMDTPELELARPVYMKFWEMAIIKAQVSRETEIEEELAKSQKPNLLIICDRGLPDNLAYAHQRTDGDKQWLELLQKYAHLSYEEMWARYEAVVKMDSLAVNFPSFYDKMKASNPARSEDSKGAQFNDNIVDGSQYPYSEFPGMKTGKYLHLTKYQLSSDPNIPADKTDLAEIYLNPRDKEWEYIRDFICQQLSPFKSCTATEARVALVAKAAQNPFYLVATCAMLSCMIYFAYKFNRRPKYLSLLEENDETAYEEL